MSLQAKDAKEAEEEPNKKNAATLEKVRDVAIRSQQLATSRLLKEH